MAETRVNLATYEGTETIACAVACVVGCYDAGRVTNALKQAAHFVYLGKRQKAHEVLAEATQFGVVTETRACLVRGTTLITLGILEYDPRNQAPDSVIGVLSVSLLGGTCSGLRRLHAIAPRRDQGNKHAH